MLRWIIGIGFGMTVAISAFGQESPRPVDKPLRSTYYACVKAAHGVTLTLNNCVGAEHDYQDKRLNAAYQKLRASLSQEQRTALRDEERSWIIHRDNACAPDPHGGTANMLDSNQCLLNQTVERAIALEDRTR
ncbi:DUF1311 domain-containing protein [Luteibacter anthropi]|uniref:lysozyme inhibitor LprI family protein n=1 Tax=Luteibacter anthropi TaxID=564369 RepID=UPI002032988B|nr:lysozyme inhibitor LprI family protein [Luteibacter anthropi]URX64234.1 DUF1311 domain-containing protein [Luteibacter anthropi]